MPGEIDQFDNIMLVDQRNERSPPQNQAEHGKKSKTQERAARTPRRRAAVQKFSDMLKSSAKNKRY